MFGSLILDVAVGMAFIYLVLSLVASGVNEILAAVVQSRAANLERGLRSLFSGDSIEAGTNLVENLYDHGLIRGLYPDPEKDLGVAVVLSRLSKFRLWLQKVVGMGPGTMVAIVKNPLLLPSYIPARTFAVAMIDILNRDKFNGKTAIQNIEDFLSSHHQEFENNKAVQALLSLLVDAKNDAKKEEEKLQRFQANLENWYNDAMDRVSGWYKRYTQRVLLTVGFVIAIVFNVNSIHVAHVLWVDRDVRTGISDAASDYWKNHQTAGSTGAQAKDTSAGSDAGQSTDSGQSTQTDSSGQRSTAQLASQLKSSVQAFNEVSEKYLFPIGWSKHTRSDYEKWWSDDSSTMAFNTLITLAGWLITAGALSLGASFWFDMLNKIMVVRNTIKPQEKSASEGSKD